MPPAIPEITNIQIVQMLSEGFLVKEISESMQTNIRTIESRIKKIREMTNSKTSAHLVANYLRKQLIN